MEQSIITHIAWRVPSFKELSSLLWAERPERDSGQCSINDALKDAYRDIFIDANDWFWSGTKDKKTGLIKVIDFRDGFCGRAAEVNRGSIRQIGSIKNSITWQSGDPAKSRFSLFGSDNVVLDGKTGLFWQREAAFLKVDYATVMLLQPTKSGKSLLEKCA